MDVSDNVGGDTNLNTMKTFLSQLVGRMSVDSCYTRVYVLFHSTKFASWTAPYELCSVTAHQSAINEFTYSTHTAYYDSTDEYFMAYYNDIVNPEYDYAFFAGLCILVICLIAIAY